MSLASQVVMGIMGIMTVLGVGLRNGGAIDELRGMGLIVFSLVGIPLTTGAAWCMRRIGKRTAERDR